MAVCDPIADMLTRIRNANRAGHASVEVPSSRFKKAVVKVLKDEGYLKDFTLFEAVTPTGMKTEVIKVQLKYGDRGERILTNLDLISKQGRRIFRGVGELPKFLDGLGIGILSTSKGVMSDREARKQRVGGELICRVW
ncbi:MAG: 30S ribosomal protein S8 [Planctomycetes bacterium]|nr:30S ribosomal protein S8 [Planctomycetota bacterium]